MLSLPPVRPRSSAPTPAAARLRCGIRSGSAPAPPRSLPRPPYTPPRLDRAPGVRLPTAQGGGLYVDRGGCSRSLGGLVASSARPQHYTAAAPLARWPPARPAHYLFCPPSPLASGWAARFMMGLLGLSCRSLPRVGSPAVAFGAPAPAAADLQIRRPMCGRVATRTQIR